MAEKKGVGHAYNVDFLNVVFAASSLFLFLSVVWMVWDDYDRDWKNTQRRFAQLEYQVTQAQFQQAARARRQEQAARSSRRSTRRRRRTSQANQAEGRRAAGEAGGSRQSGCSARRSTTSTRRRPTTRTATTSRPSRASAQSSSAEEGRRASPKQAKRLTELNLAGGKADAENAPASRSSSGQYTGEVDDGQKQIDGHARRADAAAEAARRARAERR